MKSLDFYRGFSAFRICKKLAFHHTSNNPFLFLSLSLYGQPPVQLNHRTAKKNLSFTGHYGQFGKTKSVGEFLVWNICKTRWLDTKDRKIEKLLLRYGRM